MHDGPTLGIVDLLPREHGSALSGHVCRFGKVEEHVLSGGGGGSGEEKQWESLILARMAREVMQCETAAVEQKHSL